ncbi:hypothetical protein DL770_001800 [Monosporascus sp. CRB-9-2]|nr:hypothetical protein DL770_001800 [Monosporascus sp. CRB-9-2]
MVSFSNGTVSAHNQLTRHACASSSSRNALLPLARQPFGIELCGKVARLLNGNGVENLLWGSHLMATYTVPVVIQELACAIPRSQVHTAIDSLEAEGILLCRDRSCSWSRWQETAWQRSGDQKPAHFYLDYGEVGDLAGPDWNTVQLHAMEDVLWEVSAEGRGVGFSDGMDNNIIFANDPGLRMGSPLQGWGRFPASCPGVRLPTWQRYVEALILLALSSDGYACTFWYGELCHVAEVENPDRLGHPTFTKFLKGLSVRPQSTFRAEIAEARESLGSRLHPRRGS